MKTNKNVVKIGTFTLIIASVFVVIAIVGQPISAAKTQSDFFQIDSSGELVRPTDYRSWVFVGTPVTPNELNGGNAPFPEFHNVYIDPVSYQEYIQTGKFRDGTIMVKELVSVGSKQAVSGKGYFQGEFIGLEATIKSSKHFAKEPGNWAYFSFTNKEGSALKKRAKAFPASACNACHASAAKDDFVFTQYYPVLRAAKNAKMNPENKDVRASLRAESSAFYVVTNKADGNTVVGYARGDSGIYEFIGEFSTGGKGTGDLEIPALKKDENHPLANGDDPLISANAIAATDDSAYALVVNPGDGTVALLKVNKDKSLTLINTAPASDRFPISIGVHGDSVVVASVGNDNNHGSISAFKIKEGKLTPVVGSRRDLKARPSTIDFSTDGSYVIVNELVTGKIHAFAYDGTTLSETPVSSINSPRRDDRFQAIPVGFTIGSSADKDIILMSEARFLTADFKLRQGSGEVVQSPLFSWQTGSLSSYTLSGDGKISLVTADALTGDGIEGGELANCWVALSRDGSTVWTANALSSSISAYTINPNGVAKLKYAKAFKIDSERLFFSDMAVSKKGDELFQLVGNRGQIIVFDIEDDQTLTPKQIISGLPELGTYGLLCL